MEDTRGSQTRARPRWARPTGLFVPEHALVSRRALKLVASLTVCAIVVAAAGVTRTDPEIFPSLSDAAWWAASTVTTVGYGDYVPESLAGRIIATGIMFGGIGLVSILTAAIASALLSEDVGDEERYIDQELERVRESLRRIEAHLGIDERTPNP